MIGLKVTFICMCFRWFFISIYEVYNKVKEKEFFVVWNKLEEREIYSFIYLLSVYW